MDKEDVVHIYSGILFSRKKNEIMPFAATWMDLKMIIISEVSQTERDFPAGPVVKNPRFHCRGHRFDPWLGN